MSEEDAEALAAEVSWSPSDSAAIFLWWRRGMPAIPYYSFWARLMKPLEDFWINVFGIFSLSGRTGCLSLLFIALLVVSFLVGWLLLRNGGSEGALGGGAAPTATNPSVPPTNTSVPPTNTPVPVGQNLGPVELVGFNFSYLGMLEAEAGTNFQVMFRVSLNGAAGGVGNTLFATLGNDPRSPKASHGSGIVNPAGTVTFKLEGPVQWERGEVHTLWLSIGGHPVEIGKIVIK